MGLCDGRFCDDAYCPDHSECAKVVAERDRLRERVSQEVKAHANTSAHLVQALDERDRLRAVLQEREDEIIELEAERDEAKMHREEAVRENDRLAAERDRLREALVRIAGTPTKNSSDEAKQMARAANAALEEKS